MHLATDRNGPKESGSGRMQPKVILGVAASDAHVVANHLIAHVLRENGYDVRNLGTCTPVSEFAQAATENPDAIAVVIGSLNGHVHEDLRGLREARASRAISCPVIVGGNLSVGNAHPIDCERLYGLGVDHVLDDPAELTELLVRLAAGGGDNARLTAS